MLNPYQPMMHAHPSAFIQDGIFVFNGRFTLPLASALPHADRAQALAAANNHAAALREAMIAESIAPGAVEPELVLGDTEAAVGNKDAARKAYARAASTIDTMEPDARDQWMVIVQKKLAAL